jgi:hypothetical protein
MILKIAATIAVIFGAIGYCMAKLDEANYGRYSDKNDWYAIIGGGCILIGIIAFVTTIVAAIWDL